MSLNLHEIVGDFLTVVNDWQDLKFVKTTVEWDVNSRDPIRHTTTLNAKAKMQPASLQEIRALGVEVVQYPYFKFFMTGEPTQIDHIDQFGADEFEVNGYRYKVVAKEAWDDAGWREFYAYRMEKADDGTANL